MAAIGPGWATAAWIEASWVAAAWAAVAVVLVGIPAGFFSIANCIKDPDFLAEMRKEAQSTSVWAKWELGVDLPTNPLPKGTANMILGIALIQNEAEGSAVWARWAPGTQPENTGNLQLNMRLALQAGFVLS